jgi:hypothetical protein
MAEPVVVDGTRVDPDAVTAARVETSRDVRLLAGGLAALLAGVAGPTAAVAVGVPFATVIPFGVGLFLLSAGGLALWLRSLVPTLVVETPEATYRERLDEPDRGEQLVEELSR